MRSRILASVALAALLSAPAYAQSSGSSAAPAPSKSESEAAPATGSAAGASTSSPSSAGTTSGASSTTTTSGAKSADTSTPAPPASAVIPAQEQSQLTADNLIGLDVRNPQDEKVGEIEDLVLDSDMKVVGVVVSVGGFLGMGKHDVALTRDQVEIGMKENERVATVSMTKEQLKAAPEFKTLDRQQAEAEQERARQSQGTAAGTGARPTGSGATTTPPARNQ